MTRDRRPRGGRRPRRDRRSRRERLRPTPTEAESDAERARRVRRAYAAWARAYDRFARATASVGGVRAGCVRTLDLDPGDTVVEFGCGPGVNFPALREAVGPTGRVVGVDLTGAMLDRARALVERRGWENVSLVRGDATRPPIRRADGVLATFVTSLFPDPYAVVRDWCDRADAVALASFTPEGSPPANAALWAFARLNARLFDARSADPLGQLAERTDDARRALDDGMADVERERYLFGTIAVHAGRDPVREGSR